MSVREPSGALAGCRCGVCRLHRRNYKKQQEGADMAWRVQCRPEGKKDQPNSGVIIQITNGAVTHEVSRVAWDRKASKNPKAKFEDQFDNEVTTAKNAIETIAGFEENRREGVLQ